MNGRWKKVLERRHQRHLQKRLSSPPNLFNSFSSPLRILAFSRPPTQRGKREVGMVAVVDFSSLSHPVSRVSHTG